MVERLDPQVWDILEKVIKNHPVMLNRAPTLHRLGIQAFEPTLIEGKALKLHPLVCAAFNADFDGDQMAIHLPLTQEAQAECRFMLLSPNNLLKPSDGGVVAVPSQDMVLGIYYITQARDGEPGEGMTFKSINEAFLAYENKYVTLHSKIRCRIRKRIRQEDGSEKLIEGIVDTTPGLLMFNEIIPQDLGFVDRSIPGNEILPEINKMVKKKDLKKILEKIMDVHGTTQTALSLDDIKAMGYKQSTIAAMTVSISDMTVPKTKQALLDQAQKTVDKIAKNYRRGLVTEEERYQEVIDTWKATDDQLTHDLLTGLDQYNNIFMMADSGARGSDKQIKQLAGMRGLMADTTGKTIELPIKSNFREGLDVLEYFISAHGARKGLSDTALRTADSGYLTRRMVDVTQELIIRENDCAAGRDKIPYLEIRELGEGQEKIESLQERITGRYIAEDIVDPETGKVVITADHMVTPKKAPKIMAVLNKLGRDTVKIRSVLTCRSKNGICAKCYGSNLATGQPVQVGEAVGIIAAQSIGEPGTQLTMRTFHTGGVAGGDITQGLPRVEELFEARKPKGLAILTEIPGKVEIKDTGKKREVVVTDEEKGQSKTYLIPYGSRLKVMDGQMLEAGDVLTEGSINPHDLLKIKGVEAVQNYMISEVQKVYRLQGVEIQDRHIEMIVHQMMKKTRVIEAGDSDFIPGTTVDRLDFEDENERLEAEGKKPAEGKRIILGITKASLATESFMSAASFQETTKVLTEAAINGKVDHLSGIKENVIIGKLIPAGTGMKRYRTTELSTEPQDLDDTSDTLFRPDEAFDIDPETVERIAEHHRIENQKENIL